MSPAKKNQGRTRRTDNDNYPTPWPLPLRIMERLALLWGEPPEVVLEPHAGSGGFVWASKQVFPETPVVAVEMRADEEQRLKQVGADLVVIEQLETFVTHYRPPTRTLVVGNPPFSLAEAHILLLLDFLHPGSQIAFLLKMNLLGGLGRAESFWPRAPFKYLIPIIGRPSFKKTELAENAQDEYGLYIWEAGYTGSSMIWWPSLFWKEKSNGRTRLQSSPATGR